MVFIQGTQITLRDWKLGDEELLAQNANNLCVSQFLRPCFPSPYTINDAKDWILNLSKKENLLSCAIEFDSNVIGCISATFGQNESKKSAELGYWLGQDYWGKGIMTQAVNLFVDYLFANYDLCRIFALVSEPNIKSKALLERCRFDFEGIARKSFTKDEVTYDQYVYSRTC